MKNIIDENKINEIRASVNIVDIIKNYIPLTGKGKNYFGVCPFHDDHSPSMSVSEDKQIYKCFSCGAAGNVFKFVQDYENISFIEAVSLIANKAGITLDVDIKKNDVISKNKEYYEIYDIASKLYSNNINTKDGIEAKEYLNKRDIDNNIIKEFGIGLSLKNNKLLTSLLEKKGYKNKDLLDSGLVVEKNYDICDIYYNRIMFPLYDLTGKVIGFSGRIYGDTKDQSKYINTKQTEIFKKGELLYNYHRAKDIARKKDQVIIMEGFMDVIRAYTIDVKNVIATMGTAVTKKQALLIKKMAKEVILCFDGDEAGAHATLACGNELLSIGITPKVIRLEENLDPDEYIKKHGKEEFCKKLDYPINIMDFKLSYLKNDKDLTSNIDKAKYTNEMINEINKIDDDILRELTLKKLSEETDLDVEFLRNKLNKTEIKLEKKVVKNLELSVCEKAEQALLHSMLMNNEVCKNYNNKIGYLPTLKYRNLSREISYFYKKNGEINVADFMTSLSDDEEIIKCINEIVTLNLSDEYNQELVEECIKTIRNFVIGEELKKLKNDISNEANVNKKQKIAERIVELKIRMTEEV